MATTPPEKLYVDTFEMRLVDIAYVELDSLQALSLSVGWPHRAEDWLLALEIGRGFVALDEIGRISASAMWFEHEGGFATIGMLMTSPRFQAHGTARWIAERVRAESRAKTIRVNATRDAGRLSRGFGLKPQATVYQRQGEAKIFDIEPERNSAFTLRRMERADMASVVALDAPAFGVVRARHLHRLFECSVGYCLFEKNKLRAYSMCRRFGRGHVVGPVIASCDEDAIAVTRPHLSVHSGSFVRLDTHSNSGTFAAFIQTSGLHLYDTVTTMISSDDAAYRLSDDGKAHVYALASQTLG